MNELFIDNNGKLRSGWRIVVFLLVFLFIAVVLGVISESILAGLGYEAGEDSSVFRLTNGIVSIIPALFVGWACGKKLESLPISALGASFTTGWLRHLLIGVGLGSVTLIIAVLIALAGGLRFSINHEISLQPLLIGLATSFLVLAVAAAFEEVLFRGYIFQTLVRSDLAWLAIVLTSVGFGFAHFYNPTASVFSIANTMLAGVWFGLAYLKTRDLWFVWGLHFAWNWVQGAVFGIEISGLRNLTPVSILTEIDPGPAWLTGQSYGLEGGIACTIAIIISIGLIYLLPGLKSEPPA
ncbi:MAG: CPBP family intramembrane metalloprotease [Acidobacteria bacterium]|nr:CPBP family intramembrane metalloprotease [Acidobacteriota bacterium]